MKPEELFKPEWPQDLEAGKFYQFLCDDKGSQGHCWLQIFVSPADGDVHVSMQDWEDIKEPGSKPNPLPSIRCRTYAGGGKHSRTRQALLHLALAIKLDNEEHGIKNE